MTLDHAQRAELKAHAHAAIDAATTELERGSIPRTEWQRRVAEALSAAYLADEDPRWQSGFDGDATLWREARALVLEAAPTTGTFLDVGCASEFPRGIGKPAQRALASIDDYRAPADCT